KGTQDENPFDPSAGNNKTSTQIAATIHCKFVALAVTSTVCGSIMTSAAIMPAIALSSPRRSLQRRISANNVSRAPRPTTVVMTGSYVAGTSSLSNTEAFVKITG